MKKVALVLGMLLSMGMLFGGCGYNTMQQQEERVFEAWWM